MSDRPVDDGWDIPDKLWAQIEPLLLPKRSYPKGGRPRMPGRQAMDAIFYVLRTGCQWKVLPRSLCAPRTVHDRFQEWTREGVFERLWQAGLLKYDEQVGIEWEWQAMDGAMTKAPWGEKGTGANPTNRGKKGTKRSPLTEGHGIPLAVAVEGANQHDMK
jgi:putative transposase